MDKKTFAIGILSVTGLLLLLINIMAPVPHAFGDVIKDRDYQAVTASTARGGDALYLIDNRTGKIGVFVYNNNRRAIETVDIQLIPNVFAAPPGGN